MSAPTKIAPQELSFQTITIPGVPDKISDTVGKVVLVKLKLAAPTDAPIALRGENGPLRWCTDYSGPDIKGSKREFAFSISSADMNMPVVFKCVQQGKDRMFWQAGDNINTGDLSRFGGQILVVELKNVRFEGV